MIAISTPQECGFSWKVLVVAATKYAEQMYSHRNDIAIYINLCGYTSPEPEPPIVLTLNKIDTPHFPFSVILMEDWGFQINVPNQITLYKNIFKHSSNTLVTFEGRIPVTKTKSLL